MLLRASISNTKKFFNKTLCNIKSFFSNTYQRLPKAAPPFSIGHEMDKDSSFMKNSNGNAVHFSKTIDETQMKKVEKNEDSIKIGVTHQRKTQENLKEYDERRMCSVAKKMKELEKLDARDVDHALDIEEILHYYSRLSCPTYLEIVDKFFMDIFAEFCANPSSQQINPIGHESSAGLVRRKSRLGNVESSSSNSSRPYF
ncbi:uncharacterized protein LOC111779922 [Cucurbita pepo subsp. pepo]|uniref:uncharacterized protein LOC111779922 n=1 Tax=Cucurbita pepo subsp. pepo TaxID=3664 RepID=UPI000C9D8683|nr:uncharacterized protein LOC111779922 [Cucurbita pepo subsp. pepo]